MSLRVLLVLVGCTPVDTADKPGGDTDADTDTDTDTDADTDADTDTDTDTDTDVDCEGVGFASAAVEWTLPAARFEFLDSDVTWDRAGSYTGSAVCTADRRIAIVSWSTFDVTGDLVPDLVVFRDDCGPVGLGATFWEVYEGGAAGFAATATQWTLPTARFHSPDTTSVWDRAGTYTTDARCADDRQATVSWGTEDMTGDEVPDFVVYRDDCATTGVGSAHWEVHVGGAGGFATAATEWTLPAARHGFDGTSATWDRAGTYAGGARCENGDEGAVSWGTADLTGDRIPDFLVHRDDCTIGAVGETYWEVYVGGATGFATSVTAWTLPAARHHFRDHDAAWDQGRSYTAAARCADESDAVVSWAAADVTGDDVADFVVYRDDCTTAPVGSDHWEVYVGGAAGFATAATEWTLPLARHHFEASTATWDQASAYTGNGRCDDDAEAFVAWGTADLTGDLVPDLVQYRNDCATNELGAGHWELYEGGAAGFSTAATEWPLPVARHHFPDRDATWDSTSGFTADARCADEAAAGLSWVTSDLDGDGLEDFAVLRDGCGPEGLGASYWEVYAGVCE